MHDAVIASSHGRCMTIKEQAARPWERRCALDHESVFKVKWVEVFPDKQLSPRNTSKGRSTGTW